MSNGFTTWIFNHRVGILVTSSAVCATAGFVWGIYNSVEYGNDLKAQVSELKNLRECHEKGEIDIYDPQDGSKKTVPFTDAMYKVNRKDVVKETTKLLARMYAGPAALMCTSGACMFGAVGIQSKALAISTASFNTLASVYDQYQKRVADKLGPEEEQKLRLGLKEEITTETVVDEKTGKTKEVKKKVLVEDDQNPKQLFTFYFDESTEYDPDNFANVGYFLRAQQIAANNRLKANGYVVLKDVLEHLGLPMRDVALISGWTLEGVENGDGDGHIDFRACPIKRMKNGVMIDTYILDFNVDGDIRGTKYFKSRV